MRDVTPKALRCSFGGCPAIIEVTPQDMRCVAMASCPSVFEVTPEAMACDFGASCPSVYETTPEAAKCAIGASYEQEDGHFIIGKIVAPEHIPEEIKKRIGADEQLIWTPKGLVKPGDAA
jgi:hypothetical protein